MSTRHTPGPWKHWGDGDVNSTKGHDIARVLLPYATTSRTHQSSKLKNEQRIANAHLIAAAPEMLEALKEARRELGSLLGLSPRTKRAYDLVDAAVAKARGEP